MSRLTWTSKKFLEDKVQELLCAVKNLGLTAPQAKINEYVSLTNGVKDCFIKVGILEEAGKEGKAPLLRINFANCNTDKVYAAYSLKAVKKAGKVHRIIKSKPVVTIPMPKVTTEEFFPSLEDCKKYLKHLGCYEVIQIPEGFELETITLKKKN